MWILDCKESNFISYTQYVQKEYHVPRVYDKAYLQSSQICKYKVQNVDGYIRFTVLIVWLKLCCRGFDLAC